MLKNHFRATKKGEKDKGIAKVDADGNPILTKKEQKQKEKLLRKEAKKAAKASGAAALAGLGQGGDETLRNFTDEEKQKLNKVVAIMGFQLDEDDSDVSVDDVCNYHNSY